MGEAPPTFIQGSKHFAREGEGPGEGGGGSHVLFFPDTTQSAPARGICGVAAARETLVLQRLLLDKALDSREGRQPVQKTPVLGLRPAGGGLPAPEAFPLRSLGAVSHHPTPQHRQARGPEARIPH